MKLQTTQTKQMLGREIGLTNPDARVLVFVDTGPRKAYIVEHADGGLRFKFEFLDGTAQLALLYGSKSNDPVFLDTVESAMAVLGYAFTYPDEADHVWLCAQQFAPTLPRDWRVFWDEQSGIDIKRERFYGFGDAGGIAGGGQGHETREAAIHAVMADDDCSEAVIGVKPDQLGDNAVTVLSGDEYVQRLHVLCPEGAYFYGTFKE